MEQGGSFFPDNGDSDESVSLDETELDRILAETDGTVEGASLREDPEVIVLDHEDLNEEGGTVQDPRMPSGTDEAALESGPAWDGAEETPSDPYGTAATETEEVAGEALPDLSGIPEPSFGGAEPSSWPEVAGLEEVTEVAEEETGPAETSASQGVNEEGLVFDEFNPDEPSAVEEISSLPDIVTEEEPATPSDKEWVSPVAAEEAEIAPLDLGLEPPAEDGSDDDLFPEVEEIDLDAEPSGASSAGKPAVVAEEKAPVKVEMPVSSGSFFDESDEDESVTLSADELNNILDDAVEEETVAVPAAEPEPVMSAASVAAVAMDASTGGALSQDNLKEILIYLDNLLDKLPEEEIRKFAVSRYYDLYNAIFEELGLV